MRGFHASIEENRLQSYILFFLVAVLHRGYHELSFKNLPEILYIQEFHYAEDFFYQILAFLDQLLLYFSWTLLTNFTGEKHIRYLSL